MGLTSSLIYWAVLNFFGEWVPIGPAMKLGALAPMLLGLWFGLYFHHKFLRGRGGAAFYMISSVSFAVISRVIVTSLFNFVILWYLFPDFLDFAAASLSSSLGLVLSSSVEKLLWALLFTAVFNIIHSFISFLPAYAIVKSISLAGIPGVRELWIDKIIKDK